IQRPVLPEEVFALLLGFLMRVSHKAADEVANVLWLHLVALCLSRFVVDLDQLLRLFKERTQHNVRIMVLGRPHHCFRARLARHHNRWVRFLQWQGPWVDHTILKMLAFPAEWSRLRPGCQDHIMGLFEALTIMGWVDIISQTLYPTATHKA